MENAYVYTFNYTLDSSTEIWKHLYPHSLLPHLLLLCAIIFLNMTSYS